MQVTSTHIVNNKNKKSSPVWKQKNRRIKWNVYEPFKRGNWRCTDGWMAYSADDNSNSQQPLVMAMMVWAEAADVQGGEEKFQHFILPHSHKWADG